MQKAYTLLLVVLLITFLYFTIHTEYQITFRADTESYPVLSVNTYPLCDSPLFSRDRRGAASVRYRDRAKITVLMCEQKHYPVWFSCQRKSYMVLCQHSPNVSKRSTRNDSVLDLPNEDWLQVSAPLLSEAQRVLTPSLKT